MNLIQKIFNKYNISAKFRRRQAQLKSCQCTQAQLQSDIFQEWAVQIREEPMRMHRKIWEYCYIAQALKERDKLSSGRRGLGFAVGQEPLTSLFASYGCTILATDLAIEDAQKIGWVETNQHANSLNQLNQRQICEPMLFNERVEFDFVDMRELPDNLGLFDFIWSACSLEHLGNMALGEQFIFDSLKYLKPGGVAVHTTEYNVSSNSDTIVEGSDIIFRQADLEEIATKLRSKGYKIDLSFAQGTLPCDSIVDHPPYKEEIHLKLMIADYVATSFGLIIET